jgi:uncharacterized protein (TIGR03083 family)
MAYTSDTTVAEVAALLDGQRTELLAAVGTDPATWATPSLCAGWTVRDVVSHLLMPYEMSKLTFVQRMLRFKGSFDRVANDWVERDQRTPAELRAGLERTATTKFNVPGSPTEAPLSHLLIHSQDIYRPLGHARRHDPRSLTLALDQLTSPEVRGAMLPGLLDGISLRATDVNWTGGAADGAVVDGPAISLLSALCGRPAPLEDLTGPGRARLLSRFAASDGASATA